MKTSAVIIYHNPQCSKSRETLTLLKSHGIEPTIVEYLKHPPTPTELKRIIQRLGITPRELLRSKEPEYKTAGLANPLLSDQAILAAMSKHPRLIERPIVIRNDKAAIGRPPENVLKIL
ncbi:MAG: arsenate reductase (glutaredoxin) [Gammaproteobacteria bacterium]